MSYCYCDNVSIIIMYNVNHRKMYYVNNTNLLIKFTYVKSSLAINFNP